MGWFSTSFYSSRVEAASSAVRQTLTLQQEPDAILQRMDMLMLMSSPMFFADTAGATLYCEDGEEPSCYNFGESRFIVY